ncbi:MAG: glycosyltransferase [Bacteroidota bacterium]
MSHIAIVITGLTGKLHASFEMASRLKASGHNVTYMCPANVRKKVEEQGFVYIQLPEIHFHFKNPVYRKPGSNSWIKKFIYRLKHASKIYTEVKSILRLSDFEERIRSVNPDKMLIDMELHEIILAASSLGIPFKLYSSWFSHKKHVQLPPIRTNIVPGEGWQGTFLGIALAQCKEQIKVNAKLLYSSLTLNNYRRKTLMQYAEDSGFSAKDMAASNFPPLFIYTRTPILTMAMEEMEFPYASLKNLTYIGPMVFNNREVHPEDTVRIKRLEQIFTTGKSNHKKFIYCSLGTLIESDVRFVQKVVDAVSTNPDWVLLVSFGGKQGMDKLTINTGNVHIFQWVPQLYLLSKVDCSINHGGMHTVNECIHFKVPMLIYSGKKFDQNGCAARVSYHGMGIMGDKDKDDHKTIHRNIDKVLNQPTYKEKMVYMNGVYNHYRQIDISTYL